MRKLIDLGRNCVGMLEYEDSPIVMPNQVDGLTIIQRKPTDR